MADPYELESVDQVAAATIGQPGQRQFFLVFTSQGRQLVLACEKFLIRHLIDRARQMIEVEHLTEEAAAGGPAGAQPSVATGSWVVGELGIGYHADRRRFVIVAKEVDTGSGAPAVCRVWATATQVRQFTEQAERVLASGREICLRCGLPKDPGGHPCPVANGSRPIF